MAVPSGGSAFVAVGGAAALTYQDLDATQARGAEVAGAARLSPSAISVALRTLAGHGLAGRLPLGDNPLYHPVKCRWPPLPSGPRQVTLNGLPVPVSPAGPAAGYRAPLPQ